MGVVAEKRQAGKELRWSVRRKTDAVMRLLRGEDLDTVSGRGRSSRVSWPAGRGAEGMADRARRPQAPGGRAPDRPAHDGAGGVAGPGLETVDVREPLKPRPLGEDRVEIPVRVPIAPEDQTAAVRGLVGSLVPRPVVRESPPLVGSVGNHEVEAGESMVPMIVLPEELAAFSENKRRELLVTTIEVAKGQALEHVRETMITNEVHIPRTGPGSAASSRQARASDRTGAGRGARPRRRRSSIAPVASDYAHA